jgi:hypothetical protein
LPLLLGIVASVGGDGTKLSQLVNTNAILCWQQVQELITNAFLNTGQPEFELIKLQTKAAKEKNNVNECASILLANPLKIPLTLARMLSTVVSVVSSSRKMQDDTVTGSSFFSLSINPTINA